MAHLLGAEALHLEFPTRVVFDSVTLGISDGMRVGIVGRNGDGKSSLLAMLTSKLSPDSGQVTMRGGLRLGLLSQEDELDPGMSVGQAIVGDAPEHEWASNQRIREVIDGLASDLSWDATISSLSGGQRRRVALAALLVGDWDVLALDEPTNHLDVEGISWLAKHLSTRWPHGDGALLVVTHDRWFLDAVCTTMWEVHDRIVEGFEGGYAAYVLQRVERDRQAATIEAKRQNLMRKELAWLRRGAPARTSKPKFRIQEANELIANVPEVRNPLELKRMATARLGKDVIDLNNISAGYGDNTVLEGITWKIGPGERTGILGANGAGKSTLLSVIRGALDVTAGRVKIGKTVKVATLDQQFSQLEDIASRRVREVLAEFKTTFLVDGKELTPAQLLERLEFSRAHLSARVSDLSGGQRRRLQLLLVLLREPNVLILDEPTNDVDTDMLTAMEDLLDTWPGTLLVVSHDRYLLERVTDQQYAIWNKGLRHLPGGVDEYLQLRAEQTAGSSTRSSSTATDESGGKEAGPSGAQIHQARKRMGAIERKLDKLASQISRQHDKLAGHDQSDYEGLAELTQALRTLEREVEELEGEWLELSEVATD